MFKCVITATIILFLISTITKTASDQRYETLIAAMIEADTSYQAAIVEPKQCRAKLDVCWLYHKYRDDMLSKNYRKIKVK